MTDERRILYVTDEGVGTLPDEDGTVTIPKAGTYELIFGPEGMAVIEEVGQPER